jgi:catechol 2,3-dioxygenase-like lactoylglutathione lyase family enzyme
MPVPQQQSFEFQGAYPIGSSDLQDLPVDDVERSIPFYQALGFEVEARQETPVRAAIMARGDVRLRFAENGCDPSRVSCYLAVNDVDAAYNELRQRGVDASDIHTDLYNGETYRIFFIEDGDGLRYCIGAQAQC